jgi:phospholipid/cholesterol/gamma-HCH transport system substrate-binding protein
MKGRNEVAVGAVVILAIVLLVFGTIWMQGRRPGREEIEVRARFREVGQLQDGNAVKVRGVPIGRVEAIELEATGGGVIVTMSVKSDVQLPEDPVVVLAPASMFGDWQAEIFPRSAFEQYDYAEAPDPAVLPGATLPDISRLTAVADQIARNMAVLSERFQVAFTEETATNIKRAIDNIQEVSAQLTQLVSRQQRAIDGVSGDLQQTAEALGEAVGTINRTFSQVERAISGDRLVNIVVTAERASLQIDSLTSELLRTSRTLRTTAATADTVMRSVGSVAGTLARGEGTLGLMLRDTVLYWKLVESNAELQALLKDLRTNPRRYINVRVF